MQMGIIFESEVSNDGIVKVLQHVQQYLPTVGKDDKIKFAEQGIVGDQLTIERAVNAVRSMANGYTPLDCLDGFHFGIADWHSGVKFLSVSASKKISLCNKSGIFSSNSYSLCMAIRTQCSFIFFGKIYLKFS